MQATCTWEEAVQWLREQPDQRELARHCFYDDPVDEAAKRFHSTTEWQATRTLLASHLPGAVLDVGAGRGIASYAFAREGSRVTALEPDASRIVGRAAIEDLCRRSGVEIECVEAFGERLPFPDRSFDVVYGRAVLHHARNLPALMREVARVLRPGGRALFVREHVISRPQDLQAFLDSHALHKWYGGEHAYLLGEYRGAIEAAGLRLHKMLGPWESVVNFWPSTTNDVHRTMHRMLKRRVGGRLAAGLLGLGWFESAYRTWRSRTCDTPGRLYSFLGEKP